MHFKNLIENKKEGKMSDDGIIKNTVAVISALTLTRENIDLSAEAFKLWKENTGRLTPTECVFLAKYKIAGEMLERKLKKIFNPNMKI